MTNNILEDLENYCLSKHNCNKRIIENYYANKGQYRIDYTCKNCNSIFEIYFSFIRIHQNNIIKSYFANEFSELKEKLLSCNEAIIKSIIE